MSSKATPRAKSSSQCDAPTTAKITPVLGESDMSRAPTTAAGFLSFVSCDEVTGPHRCSAMLPCR